MTCSLLRHLASVRLTDEDVAISQLAIGAFFFAMRSCEYSRTSGERRTKLLRLNNIRFFEGHRLVPHDDPYLSQSDSVSITFEYQKNDMRDVTITQHCTNDPVLCPVRAWASVVTRVRNYPGSSPDSTVNSFRYKGKTIYIRSDAVRMKLRASAAALGKDRLGFSSDEIGTHSLRSGSAMAMYLNEVPVYTIMLIGRWSSDAFLRYIRRQVQQFSAGVSARMIRTSHFFTVPDTFNIIHDPRTPNNRNSLASNNFGSARQPTTPVRASFALFH